MTFGADENQELLRGLLYGNPRTQELLVNRILAPDGRELLSSLGDAVRAEPSPVLRERCRQALLVALWKAEGEDITQTLRDVLDEIASYPDASR